LRSTPTGATALTRSLTSLPERQKGTERDESNEHAENRQFAYKPGLHSYLLAKIFALWILLVFAD
jgi:hypothetical protein